MLLILTENHTMRPAPEPRDLVQWAVEAERAGFDSVMVSEHIVLGPSANANGSRMIYNVFDGTTWNIQISAPGSTASATVVAKPRWSKKA